MRRRAGAFTPEQRAATLRALQAWSDVAQLNFFTDNDDPEIAFRNYFNANSTELGRAVGPSHTTSNGFTVFTLNPDTTVRVGLNLERTNGNNLGLGRADYNTLVAYFGGNTLIGGDGNDRLEIYEGGAVASIMTGGADSDTFVFRGGVSAWQVQTVTDFEDGVDRIELVGFTQADVTIADSAAGAVISYFGNEMTFTGMSASQITASDFLLV